MPHDLKAISHDLINTERIKEKLKFEKALCIEITVPISIVSKQKCTLNISRLLKSGSAPMPRAK